MALFSGNSAAHSLIRWIPWNCRPSTQFRMCLPLVVEPSILSFKGLFAYMIGAGEFTSNSNRNSMFGSHVARHVTLSALSFE